MQYVGSTKTKFRTRFNNYKSAYRNFAMEKQEKVLQKEFHEHFRTSGHYGMEDWNITLIDHASTERDLRRRESFWQHKLNCFVPEGLNTCEVPIT